MCIYKHVCTYTRSANCTRNSLRFDVRTSSDVRNVWHAISIIISLLQRRNLQNIILARESLRGLSHRVLGSEFVPPMTAFDKRFEEGFARGVRADSHHVASAPHLQEANEKKTCE